MKLLVLIILLMVIIGCNAKTEEIQEDMKITGGVGKMKLTSPAFENNKEMPSEYTCDGANIIPELNIEDVPENAKSLALIMDDPDAPAGTWVHWVVWNIPPDTKTIAKGTEPQGMQGKTSFGKMGYGGPCPPSGTHSYIFKLYALDAMLDLREGSTKENLESAMDGHIIEQAELIGPYRRK
ncbi:MAG: YbhB/YbcL family Raf kinase inhibitor-like protein [Candidatus Woesearchaeota archaeon]